MVGLAHLLLDGNDTVAEVCLGKIFYKHQVRGLRLPILQLYKKAGRDSLPIVLTLT